MSSRKSKTSPSNPAEVKENPQKEPKIEELSIGSSLIKLFLFDCTAIPILAAVQALSPHLNVYTLPILGSIVCIGVVYVGSKILPPCRDPWYYFFILCSWTCVVDSVLFLETIGLSQGVFDLWLNIAEPYLDTTWGAGVNLIDATLHYSLYLILIKRQLEGKNYDLPGLFWCGSILNSMSVLIGAAVWGNSQGVHELKAGITLNIPYVLLPLLFFMQKIFGGPVEPQNADPQARGSILSQRLFPLLSLLIAGAVDLMAIPTLTTHLQCSNIFTRTQYYVGLGFAIILINFQLDANSDKGKKMAYFIAGQGTHALLSTLLQCAVL